MTVIRYSDFLNQQTFITSGLIMPRGVGYIAGVDLEDLQSQWVQLLDQNVDVILFDRMVLNTPYKPGSTDPADVENSRI